MPPRGTGCPAVAGQAHWSTHHVEDHHNCLHRPLPAGLFGLAETNKTTGDTITLATSSGIWVRVRPAEIHGQVDASNVAASAINTGGVTRATRAVKKNGRVFLTGSRTMKSFQSRPAVVARVPRRFARPPRGWAVCWQACSASRADGQTQATTNPRAGPGTHGVPGPSLFAAFSLRRTRASPGPAAGLTFADYPRCPNAL